MTAPVRNDPTTVKVALGARSYDIVIGRGVLASLGERVAAMRPGVRTAIVTDRTVAKYWLEPTEASLAAAGTFFAAATTGMASGFIPPKYSSMWNHRSSPS